VHAGTKQSFTSDLCLSHDETPSELPHMAEFQTTVRTRGTELPPLVLCTLCTSILNTRIHSPHQHITVPDWQTQKYWWITYKWPQLIVRGCVAYVRRMPTAHGRSKTRSVQVRYASSERLN
jgi:hypothetical protein